MSDAGVRSPAASQADDRDLFENAPCGYLLMTPDGVIERVNETLSRWLEMTTKNLVGKRFRDLLTIPGRIFYETNIAPPAAIAGRV